MFEGSDVDGGEHTGIRKSQAIMVRMILAIPIVSIVVPFWGYLIGSYLYIWLNQKRNYNGDYR